MFRLRYGLLLILLLACNPGGPVKSNIMIISAEKLPTSLITCLEEDYNEFSVNTICSEFVRYTHAYTPSPLSKVALSAMYTAKNPFELGISNNAEHFLAEEFWSIGELALDRGYRTAFFTGGGSVWRHSGLHQGMEVFSEHPANYNNLYSDARTLRNRFVKWHKSRVSRRSFFAHLHFVDMDFPTIATTDDLGNVRERSLESQWSHLKSSWSKLFREMKRNKTWDNSYVIIVGVNGRTPVDRRNEFASLNLHSENTQVGLFIKPPRKKRDLGLAWKIDHNVSLLDVGMTIFDILGQKPNDQGLLKAVSLLPTLLEEEVNWDNTRPILMESGWAKWKNLSNIRNASLIGKKLFFNSDPVIYYNTLIDQKEQLPIPAGVSNLSPVEIDLATSIFNSTGTAAFADIEYQEIKKIKVIKQIQVDGFDPIFVGELQYLALNGAGKEVSGQLAGYFLQTQSWKKLKGLGLRLNRPEWVYVANKNLGLPLGSTKNLSPCFVALFSESVKPDVGCGFALYENLVRWKSKKGKQKEYWREKFVKEYNRFLYRLELQKLNYVADLKWPLRQGTDLQSPSWVDLFLQTESNARYAEIVKKRSITSNWFR
ncbi:MAG: sulfatase-like hydrolase/transferase [Bdellovibrionales bacterium]